MENSISSKSDKINEAYDPEINSSDEDILISTDNSSITALEKKKNKRK